MENWGPGQLTSVQHEFAGKTHMIFCLALVQDKKISHH
jgi:hypothetical protein